MNIFEGARRIALIMSALIIIGGLIAAYQVTPNVIIGYRIPYFGVNAVKSMECADFVDAKQFNIFSTPSGREFRIRTCFAASKANNGKMLIPYTRAEDGMFYMGSEYSDDVREYMRATAEAITPTKADYEEADREYLYQWWVERLKVAGWLVGGLICFWLLVQLVGWVVRGFAGIPAGHDRKPISHGQVKG